MKSKAVQKQVSWCRTPLNTPLQLSPIQLSPSHSNQNHSFTLPFFSPNRSSTRQCLPQITAGMSNVSSRSAKSLGQTYQNSTDVNNQKLNGTCSLDTCTIDARKPHVMLETTSVREIREIENDGNTLSTSLTTSAVKGAEKEQHNRGSTPRESEYGKGPNISHRTDSGGHVKDEAGELLMSSDLSSTHILRPDHDPPSITTCANSVPISRAEKKAMQW